MLISPTVILGSLGIGVLLCVLLSTGAAAVVMPAVLIVLGRRLEFGSFPAPRPVAAAWYQVFLLARMREHVLAGDSPRAAARHGLRHTAAAVTGTAAVMVAATIPFLFTDLLSVRQFGVAVATVVLIDALLIRPIVLPAAVELLGRRAWWPTQAPHPKPGSPGATPSARPPATPHIDPTPVNP